MPVSQLLCEGGQNSPDVRLLGKLLAGECEVSPSDGHYGLGNRVFARREILGPNRVYGILDRDFVKDWAPIENRPLRWIASVNEVHLGWRWERKEIENYLIDPVVVEKSLGKKSPERAPYTRALKEARDRIALYQAARMALSSNRVRFKDLSSKFGRRRGKDKHLLPDRFDEETCREGFALGHE